MKDFILFMYDDVLDSAIANDDARWGRYFASLRASGQFDGGSSIGVGTKFRKGHANEQSTAGMNGFIRVRAEGMTQAIALLATNPTYEAGGTVEIRELPQDQ